MKGIDSKTEIIMCAYPGFDARATLQMARDFKAYLILEDDSTNIKQLCEVLPLRAMKIEAVEPDFIKTVLHEPKPWSKQAKYKRKF